MTPKEIAKEIDKLSLEESRQLVEELFILGYKAPETTAITEKAEAVVEEKNTFQVTLQDAGGSKSLVIKFWKQYSANPSLMEAKKEIDKAPSVLKSGLNKQEADDLKKELEALGATATIS
jgi:large subunit ribosomal protein L7/L12